MKIPYVELVKEAIGTQAVEALRVIFENRKGEPPSVPILRFRADHDEYLNTLDNLEGRYSLIGRSSESNEYLIRPYALPLIGTPESERILNLMDKTMRDSQDYTQNTLLSRLASICYVIQLRVIRI